MEHEFQDLPIWQKSIELVRKVYELTEMLLNNNKHKILIDRMVSSVISFGIILAKVEVSKDETVRKKHLAIVKDLKIELLAELEICKVLEIVPLTDRNYPDGIRNLIGEIDEMLNH